LSRKREQITRNGEIIADLMKQVLVIEEEKVRRRKRE